MKQSEAESAIIICCYECKYGVHNGTGDQYLCTVSPELMVIHEGNFYCGYAERGEK